MADRDRERLGPPPPPPVEPEARPADQEEAPAELNPYLRESQGTPEPGPP